MTNKLPHKRRDTRQSACRRLYPALLTCLLLINACDETPSTSETTAVGPNRATQQNVIAFVGAGEGDPLWPILKTGAETRAAQLDSVRVIFENPPRQTPRAQIETLQKLPKTNLRGLCIHITDVDALTPILNDLRLRSVQIVSMINPAPETIRAAHVGLDERAIGTALAQVTADTIGQGTIALLCDNGEPPYNTRQLAFEEEIRQHPQIELFATKSCQGNPKLARDTITAFSQRFPRLSAWVALEDWPLRNQPFETLNLPPGCKFITFGGFPRQWPLLESAVCPAVVAANYRLLGDKALTFCEIATRITSEYERHYDAPLRTVWPTNLEEHKNDWAYWSTGRRHRTGRLR